MVYGVMGLGVGHSRVVPGMACAVGYAYGMAW